ncbi:MAG TPA: hypothetical protein PKE39_03315 [Ignavibacteria bacterium]|nr:hypothetical protein [Ignavibacteria bacterium]HMQ98030.1 hypothetical protein [Ignavibacteria bacterium]
MELKNKRLQKFNIILAFAMMIALSIFANTNILFAQQFKEVNFPDGSVAGTESRINTNANYRIYQYSQNVIKFELPEVSFVKIGLYDNNNNLIRTYLYNNLKAGTYEININSTNLDKGNYTCVLSSADVQESSKVIIE